MKIEELFTLENLNKAFYESAKASQWKDSTQRYRASLLQNNVKLREELLNGTYEISPTFNFTLCERGKIRLIEAPAIRDRVVQKILCQKILIPQLSKYLIYDNYASLKGRGTSFARKRIHAMLQKYVREHGNKGYVLQVDVKGYFASIDHEILKHFIRGKIHEDDAIMSLIDYMIDTSSDSGRGLNLGSEIPQISAVFYLSKLDNYIKTVKGFKYYGRYMDDMIIISDSKDELRKLLCEIERQLLQVKLRINLKKTHITKLSHGFTFMQIKYNVDNGKIVRRPTHAKVFRERRRLRKFKALKEKGILSEAEISNCYKSWRNAILKDSKNSKKTIYSIDILYNKLFPQKDSKAKPSRKTEIENLFNQNIRLLLEIGYENMNEMEKKYVLSFGNRQGRREGRW